MDASVARRMWQLGETLHAVTYFAPESFAAWEAAGIRGFWRGYFATRAAPFGGTGPGPVVATFFNFAPGMVARALPAVWQLATPEDALRARVTGAADALRAALGPALDPAAVDEALALVRGACAGCDPSGRALHAANAWLPWPDEPVEALWHGLTILREHRGDGHNALLVAAGLDGCECHVLAGALASGGASGDDRRSARGWSDEDWSAATARLVDRGLLDGDGSPTEAGRSLHADVEARTDELALGPWSHLGADRTSRLAALLEPWAVAISERGVLRYPNPMGLAPVDGSHDGGA